MYCILRAYLIVREQLIKLVKRVIYITLTNAVFNEMIYFYFIAYENLHNFLGYEDISVNFGHLRTEHICRSKETC